MNKNFGALNPTSVWHHFEQISKIPRPSGSEEQIRQYVIDFAKAHSLECIVDEANNVLVRKPASAGMEDRKGVVMQAHLDMVPQKNNDTEFDFLTDSIEAYIDGDWVTANGTTLGADNGIGAAAMLAVLEDKSLVHGNLESLFTATEETGMDGAFGLKGGLLQGDILLNLDSEDEGELFVGCAGGMDANITFDYIAAEAATENTTTLELNIKGLKGGHSGIQIVTQRANANILLARLILELNRDQKVELSEIDGGGLRNAIPREAKATVVVESDKVAQIMEYIKVYQHRLVTEFDQIEESITIEAEVVESATNVIPSEVAANVLRAIVAIPNGVTKMSTSMHGLVQTSNNLARVVSDGKTIKIQCLMRSSLASEKDALANVIVAICELANGKCELMGGYDGWNPNLNSPILKAMRESYQALYGVEPKVTAIHAGLECGIIGSNYPNLDMISFGPTICYPHSPDEKVEIASVAKFYDFLTHTLANTPLK